MKVEAWEQELAQQVWNAQTSGEVERVLKIAEKRYGTKRIPVGRSNNIGTIRIASDPGLALVERITNGIDALLEMAVLLNPGPEPSSPEEAARRFFGVPKGGLGDMTDGERRMLARNLVVSLHESGVTARPTVRVQDAALGQHPDDFAKTLLSLNDENKVGKPYTIGTYGQGGSVTLGFAEWTVIVSRRHPKLLGGKSDVVGWTVAFEEEADPAKNELSRYVWIVKADGSPLRFSPSALPELETGTRITHIGYDVQGLKGPFTTQMWQFLHAALFEPVLPFMITGDRKTDIPKKTGTVADRVVIGNLTRLNHMDRAKGDVVLGASDTHKVDLGPKYGSVEMSWWALVRPESSSSSADAAGAYVTPTSAVSLTLHGQRHDSERRTWIKDKALLPHLYKNMVVHINANGLKPPGRRELFASTRERATESELRRLIYDTLADLLRNDPELKRLNHEEKNKLLSKSTAVTSEKIRNRLSRFIKTRLQGLTKPAGAKTGSGNGGSGKGGPPGDAQKGKDKKEGGSNGGGRNIDDTHLHKVPTEIRFDSKVLRVARGFSGYVWVLIDAKNGYLPDHDDDLDIRFTGPAADQLHVRSRSTLLGGKSRWSVHAASEAVLGECVMTVEMMTSHGPLTASIPVAVVEPPDPTKPPEGGADEETGPDVRWVSGAEREAAGLNAKSVGRVDEDDESTIILVCQDFDLLEKAMSSSRLSGDAVESRRDRYLYPVACGLWLQHFEQKKAEPKPEEAWLEGEMRRLAEAVLVAIEPDVDLANAESED